MPHPVVVPLATTSVQITEYKPLPGSPSSNHIEKRLQVTVLENIYWKELGLLTFVWVAYLALQIAKVVFLSSSSS